MRPLRTRLQEARRRTALPSYVIERDYLLSWVLAGVGHVPELSRHLVFKGGTALKKCYFGDYRFSEDLDFSGLEDTPTGADMAWSIGQVCEATRMLMEEYAPVSITCRRYEERQPHPGGQEAFNIYAIYPWQSEPLTRVRVEITMDEPIIWTVQNRRIIHDYEETLDAEVRTYSLEEIVAEKLRAVLQQTQALRERGWSRSRARDYYDLWRILGTFLDRMDLTDFPSLLREKCAVRDVEYHGSDDFFDHDMLSYVKDRWRDSLGPLVPVLPLFETIIDELSPLVGDTLGV